MKKKVIVVTGAAGFIGSHLCESLYNDGFEIVGIDNLITGRLENLASLLGSPGFKFIQIDVSEPVRSVERGAWSVEREAEVVAVVHLASPASPKDYLAHPIETLRTGSFGTYYALELARSSSARFLLASTSEVYGDPLKHPQDESYWGNVNPIGPRSVYDESKRFAEALTMAYHRKYRVDTKIARIFNTYGPRMRLEDGRALPNFFSQSLKNEPISIYGDGKQTRSFCYIDDMVQGLLKLLWSGENEPINLGNPEEVSILQLASEIKELSLSSSEFKFLPPAEDDPSKRRPDISRAEKVLGWKPTVTRTVGLARTMEYFKSIIR
ncbi:MAG: SDR family oxidoreductase [Planctomycetota bacterium]|nr:SDR family oxidoreductase [Planctomycetota bacterium]MDI6787790.1 SDR family oxidoreductase [Planctomycetota bacterium]